MRSHLERSLFDVITEIAIPVCIMGLVGGLVYFLVDLRSLYFPGGSGLLKYVFFFYIIATVLINRIRALLGTAASAVYSFFLGAAVLLFLMVFSRVMGPMTGGTSDVSGGVVLAVNISIMALIWFLSDRLTKSCHIDEDDDTMAQGLVSGVRYRRLREEPPKEEKPVDFKENLPRKHPGMAVAYFSCMSLLFFGVGLRLIPAQESWVRVKTFWCMVVYVFSAFSLLMLTSFSGLRHYFRKRKMAVPARIAGFWLLFGWAVAILVLVLADVFPQPHGGGPRLRTEVPAIGRTVNTGARFSRSLIEGLASSNRTDEQKGWLEDTGDEEGQREGRGADEEQGEPGGDKGGDQRGEARTESTSARQSKTATRMSGKLNLGPVVTKLAIAILVLCGLVVLWFVLLGACKMLGSLGQYRRGRLGSASRLFRRLGELLGLVRKIKPPQVRLPRRKKLRVKVKNRASLACYRFRNPFRDPGLKARLAPADLVRYSYGALMAFAKDAGFPRQDDQTPYEFAVSLPEGLPRLSKPTSELTEMFVRAEYAPQTITGEDVARLQSFWSAYESTLARVFR